MSLQYALSSELNGVSNIKITYTLNVMASGLGVMLGPSLSGALLDKYNRDYKIIFELSFLKTLWAVNKLCYKIKKNFTLT